MAVHTSTPTDKSRQFWLDSPGALLREWRWLLGAAVASIAVMSISLLFNSRFFFTDDTQVGAWPVWITIGESLRSGQLPILEPTRWSAGNVLMEGQWGFYNPLVWIIGLLATVIDDGRVLSDIVKLAFVAIAATGAYAVARSYGAVPRWAFVAGIAAPLGGFTMYVDAPSWVTALFVWALGLWTWWGLRAVGHLKSNVLWAFIPGYLLVTIGYVHGTVMLVVTILGILLEIGLRRDWRGARRVFVSGVLLGLVAVAVYLPGLLSVGVTARASGLFGNSNFFSPDPSSLLYSMIPTATPLFAGWWSGPATAPLAYVSWFILLAILVRWRDLGRNWTDIAALIFIPAAAALVVFGPSEIGPLRFPGRILPFVTTPLLILTAVGISRWPAQLTRGRLAFGGIWLFVGLYLAFADNPASPFAFTGGAVLAAIAAAVVWRAERSHNRDLAVAVTAVLATAVIVAVQHSYFIQSPLRDFGVPASRDSYRSVLSEAQGDTLVIGGPRDALYPTQDVLLANDWLLSDASVINTYTPIMHKKYAEELCQSPHGLICPSAGTTLLSTDPVTGEPLVDLLSLSTVAILADQTVPEGESPNAGNQPATYLTMPAGWTKIEANDVWTIWTRDEPVPGAGTITWASDGVEYSNVKVTKTQVSFDVDSAPKDGQVTFSRLAWPGYTAQNATLCDPVRGYLLTVDVGDSVGERVVVKFRPPGWHVEIAALVAALSGATLWALIEPIRRRRRRDVPAKPAS